MKIRVSIATEGIWWAISQFEVKKALGSACYCYKLNPLLTNPVIYYCTVQTDFRGCRANFAIEHNGIAVLSPIAYPSRYDPPSMMICPDSLFHEIKLYPLLLRLPSLG
jgi:hypothetical protein